MRAESVMSSNIRVGRPNASKWLALCNPKPLEQKVEYQNAPSFGDTLHISIVRTAVITTLNGINPN